jgi:methylated-DNA-[protein]-cysteine S-methyltransferase
LQEFLSGSELHFNLALDLHGTSFQQRVWRALMAIPVGQVRSYGELARELRTSARAIANACRANPIAIIVPCHRVVGAHGLGGYMGALSGEPLAIKEWLLRHEGAL